MKNLQSILFLFLLSFAFLAQAQVGKICNWEGNKKAAVVMTFDDWSAGHNAIVVPELKTRNLVATFYVNSGNIGSWANVSTAATNGNEIGNHTKTHVAVNTSNFSTEVAAAKTVIESNVTSQKVTTFAYPFGTVDAGVLPLLKSSGCIAARGVGAPGGGQYSYSISDYYNYPSFSVYTATTTPAFTTQLQNVINGGGLLTYLYHSVNSQSVVDNNYEPVSQTNLQAQLTALQSYESAVWVTTFSNAVKYHREKNCASLTQVQAPDGIKWIVKLSDTLYNNAVYDYPLTLKMKMNGVNYDKIMQNGNTLTIDSKVNDTITFRAVPDGGDITLSLSSGTSVVGSATPSSFVNTAATLVKFAVEVVSTKSITVTSVKINLSSVGGGSAVNMTSLGNNKYEYSYTIAAGISAGSKTVTVTVVDNSPETNTTDITLTVLPSFTYLDIYTDASSMVNGTWGGVTEQSNSGASEGTKDYVFAYTISSYWAGAGLDICGWADSGAKDFSDYDSLQISYKGPASAGTGIAVSLIGTASKKSTSKSLPLSAAYTTAKIGLSEFGVFDLTKVTEIAIDITGAASGAGTLKIDNIRLIKTASITTDVQVFKTIANTASVFPNPFANEVTFIISSDENKMAAVNVVNMLGDVVYTSAQLYTNQNITFGKDFAPGIYFVDSTVSGQHQVIKICKN